MRASLRLHDGARLFSRVAVRAQGPGNAPAASLSRSQPEASCLCPFTISRTVHQVYLAFSELIRNGGKLERATAGAEAAIDSLSSEVNTPGWADHFRP